MRKSLPIGIFDSGLGGLTVLKEVKKVLPSEDIVYLGDTARIPYGTRSSETINEFARDDIKFLLSKNVKCIIVACGTVSSMAIKTVKRQAGDLAVFDLVSSGVGSIEHMKCPSKVGVIGTRATIRGKAYDHAILTTHSKCKIFKQACPLIVSLVEEGETSGKIIQMVVGKYLQPLKKEDLSCLILGCTHFPIVQEVISKTVGKDVEIINPGVQIAMDVKKYLKSKDLLSERKKPGNIEYYVTDLTDRFQMVAEMFLGEKINGKVKTVNL